MFLEQYILSLFISYLIGSIPTAFLVVKKTSSIDIRTVGSGNVGGRNALEVTGKKWVGVVVTLIDLFKGIGSVLIASYVFEDKATAVSAAMFGSVLGHCYPVWLKFQGGRGLATGAGSLLVTSWVWVPLWLVLYFGSEKITKNVHASSVIALVAMPLVIWLVPDEWIMKVTVGYFTPQRLFTAGSLIAAVCLSRHLQPLKMYFDEKNA
ncbi:MAG TPA: glycerol-3-phosphate acyltransferase [Bacteroidetes bacterium]|nr:glycerol-3-phosphate acyltransferase [Bacteroidota bacterium]